MVEINALLDRTTGTGTRNINYANSIEDAGPDQLKDYLKQLRENRSAVAETLKSSQKSIEELAEYIATSKGIDLADAEVEALNTYNYLKDNPSYSTSRVTGQPSLLDIGTGELIKEYEKDLARTPVFITGGEGTKKSDTFIKDEETDYSRSTIDAIFDPVGESKKRAISQTASDLDLTPQALREELENTTADFLGTGADQIAFKALQNNEKIENGEVVKYDKTIFRTETDTPINQGRTALFKNVALQFGMSDRISTLGGDITISSLGSDAVNVGNATIIEADLGLTFTVLDGMLNRIVDRNEVLPMGIIPILSDRADAIPAKLDAIRKIYSQADKGSIGAEARQLADQFRTFYQAGDDVAAEKARVELDELLLSQLAGVRDVVPTLLQTTFEQAEAIKNGILPSNYIKAIIANELNTPRGGEREFGTGAKNVLRSESAGGPKITSETTEKELENIINATNGDISNLIAGGFDPNSGDLTSTVENINNIIQTSLVDEVNSLRATVANSSQENNQDTEEIETMSQAFPNSPIVKFFSRDERAARKLNSTIANTTNGLNNAGTVSPNRMEEKALAINALITDETTREIALGDPRIIKAIQYLISKNKEYAKMFPTVSQTDVAQTSTEDPPEAYAGGIMTPRLNTGGTIDETLVTAPREDTPAYDLDLGFVNNKSNSRAVKDTMASSRDIGDMLFQSDPEFFAKLSFAQKADKEAGTTDNVKNWEKEMIARNQKRYGNMVKDDIGKDLKDTSNFVYDDNPKSLTQGEYNTFGKYVDQSQYSDTYGLSNIGKEKINSAINQGLAGPSNLVGGIAKKLGSDEKFPSAEEYGEARKESGLLGSITTNDPLDPIINKYISKIPGIGGTLGKWLGVPEEVED